MRFVLPKTALLLTAISCLATAASAGTLYFEDFEVEAGTPLTDLGFTDVWNQGSEVADTTELGLAFDSRAGSGGPYFPSMDIPSPTVSMSRYEISIDMYVDVQTQNSGIQVFTNTATNDSFAFIRHNKGADTWDASLWSGSGALSSYTVLSGGGSGVYNVKLVVDVPTLTMWAEVDGNASGSVTIAASDLPNMNKVWITDDPRDGPGAVFDNLLVASVPEPGSLLLLASGLIALLVWRKR